MSRWRRQGYRWRLCQRCLPCLLCLARPALLARLQLHLLLYPQGSLEAHLEPRVCELRLPLPVVQIRTCAPACRLRHHLRRPHLRLQLGR